MFPDNGPQRLQDSMSRIDLSLSDPLTPMQEKSSTLQMRAATAWLLFLILLWKTSSSNTSSGKASYFLYKRKNHPLVGSWPGYSRPLQLCILLCVIVVKDVADVLPASILLPAVPERAGSLRSDLRIYWDTRAPSQACRVNKEWVQEHLSHSWYRLQETLYKLIFII